MHDDQHLAKRSTCVCFRNFCQRRKDLACVNLFWLVVVRCKVAYDATSCSESLRDRSFTLHFFFVRRDETTSNIWPKYKPVLLPWLLWVALSCLREFIFYVTHDLYCPALSKLLFLGGEHMRLVLSPQIQFCDSTPILILCDTRHLLDFVTHLNFLLCDTKISNLFFVSDTKILYLWKQVGLKTILCRILKIYF